MSNHRNQFCDVHGCQLELRDRKLVCTICEERKKDKMDLMWGLEQIEKYLSKHHSPASNIMNICTEVQKQVSELIEQNHNI